MKAYRCDRCGKFYELTLKQREDRKFQMNDTVRRIDLCDKCFDELQEWMTVYKETERRLVREQNNLSNGKEV